MGTTVCAENRVRCLPEAVVARETCNGLDDDCDGRIDEGARSDCGGCIDEPDEVCDGLDQDCDGLLDEDAPCVPDCAGKACGADGCGGVCGECAAEEWCVNAECVPLGGCIPSCSGKACGDDGCGGSCGECGLEGQMAINTQTPLTPNID